MKRSTSDSGDDVRSEKIERAGTSIAAFFKSAGYEKKLDEHRVVALWPSVVAAHLGPEASRVAEARRVRDGELLVIVSEAA